ncbi:hypothetical protein MTO96_028257 [Rhipicephalus appendiculatus]
MEYRVEGTDIDSSELGNGEWEIILRLRKKYHSPTADKSLHSAGLNGQMQCSGSDGRRTAGESPTPSRPPPPRRYDARLSCNFRVETSRSLSDPAVVWT